MFEKLIPSNVNKIPSNVNKKEPYKKFHIFSIVYWVFLGNKAVGRCNT